MNINDSTVLYNLIVIIAACSSLFHVQMALKLRNKSKTIEDNRPYIIHLENLIKEYELTTKRQNKYLENDNNTSTSG